MEKLDPDALEPLLTAAAEEPDPALRLAALEAAAHFPLDQGAWQQVANLTYQIVRDDPPGSDSRRVALALAVQIPLLTLRQHLRGLADDPDEPDRDAIAAALQEVRDPSRLGSILAAARSGDVGAFRLLAAMPLEDEGVGPAEVPPLPQDDPATAGLWRALAVARVGDYGALDAILDGGAPEPALFWGSPWSAYAEIATIRPIPPVLHEHLLAALADCQGCPTERLVQLIAWAGTGIADAEGNPLGDEDQLEPGDVALGPENSTSRSYIEVATDETEAEPERDLAQRIVETITEANRRAAALASGIPANEAIGNEIIASIPPDIPADICPVAELLLEQLQADRPALDDDQMAWVLARGDPARVIRELSKLLTTARNSGERLRLLKLLRSVADHVSGRGGSPMRGAGGVGRGATLGRAPLIDDQPRAAAREPSPSGVSDLSDLSEPSFGLESVPEERRVHARILHAGQSRNTFVTGAENLIRCWIGPPQSDAAMADQPIPQVDIPPEGLLLKAVLSWGNQTDSKPLLLPAARDARTGDCDLRITVPDGERYVCADIAFLYRGRVFEVVQVQAFALAPGEAELPHQDVQVRVQVSRREVIELPERGEFDATIFWGEAQSRPGQDPVGPPPKPSLRVFGGQGAGHYDLEDAETALNWVNQSLFATEKSLVRQRAAQGADGARPMLDADDPEVRRLLRDMARHGAVLYNELTAQGFKDPGTRIQLLNREAGAYVPLEFVYDQGYPADDARLCDGWEAALLSDEPNCPVCSQAPLTPEQHTWMPTICPLGFWSLQKIIERLDPTTPDTHIAAPTKERRALPVITQSLFASSHRVPPEERQSVWQSLTERFDDPHRADNWDQWRAALGGHPQLLVVLPHHDVDAALDYLEIGDEQLPPQLRRLSRGQLTEVYVNPDRVDPGPIVLLLGCRTGAETEVGYASLARRFQQLHTSIVVGTLAQILGRHAAPVARELVSQLLAVDDPEADFGTIMRRVRRRMLANGYLMSLCLVALGDAEWRLTPRPGPAAATGGHAHVSP